MKKNILMSIILFSLTISKGQNCIANFGFTIDTNNTVTVYDSSSSSCTSYVVYDFDDQQPECYNSISIYFPESEQQHLSVNRQLVL